jgi:hypothetical protein
MDHESVSVVHEVHDIAYAFGDLADFSVET